MRMKMLGTNLLVASAVGLFAVNALAQDAPPPPSDPPTTSGPPVEPAPSPPPVEAPSSPPLTTSSTLGTGTEQTGLPAAGSAPAAADAPEEETYPPAWFRIDSDLGALQLWAGATHPLGDGVGLATDMYVNSGTLGEFDIGPAITAGDFVLTPMLGIQFDWSDKEAEAIVPQLYVVGGPDPIYLELWVQNYLYTPFDEEDTNTLYFRFFVDYEISKYIGLGPQIEATLALNGDGDTLTSLPIGGNIMFSNYGAGNSLFLFLGYETNEDARTVPTGVGTETEDHGLAGRLTFVKNF